MPNAGVGVALVFLAAHLAILVMQRGTATAEMTGAEPLFSLDTEKNLPVLYNTGLFVVASALFLFIWTSRRGTREAHRGCSF